LAIRGSDQVGPHLDAECEIVAVLGGDGWQRQVGPRECGPLAIPQHTAGGDGSPHLVTIATGHLEVDQAIGQHHRASGGEVGVGQVTDVDAAHATPAVTVDQIHLGAFGQIDRALRKRAHPDARALDVLEHGNRPPLLFGGFVDPGSPLVVRLVISVREVEPGDIHPGRHQPADRHPVAGRRSDRCDDLGLTVHDRDLTNHGGTLSARPPAPRDCRSAPATHLADHTTATRGVFGAADPPRGMPDPH